MKAMIIRTDNTCELVDLQVQDGSVYEGIKNAVGGWIEHLDVLESDGDDYKIIGSMYINEEGKLIGLPYNQIAHSLWGYQGWDALVGDAIVFGITDREGNETEITEYLINKINKIKEAINE